MKLLRSAATALRRTSSPSFSNLLSSNRRSSFYSDSFYHGHFAGGTDTLNSPSSSVANVDEVGSDVGAFKFQELLKANQKSPTNQIELALDRSGLPLDEDVVLNVLRRNRSDWKLGFTFFNWVSRGGNGSGYSPGSDAYNELLDILGKMKRFDELHKVLEEMSEREGIVNERTYLVVLNRYAAAHKVQEATQWYYNRKRFGVQSDVVAFQILLMCLCRFKHVETAEYLFHSMKNDFLPEIKTLNIILNGWCVLGNLREAKRFWNDIIGSKVCKPDRYTYGIFINSLAKAGKTSTAVKLFRAMSENGCHPDVAICNSVIDGLCFKKRIPEALGIFEGMKKSECAPNVATFNSLIKHLCKIRRMDKVYELMDEMEKKGGTCLPNVMTYGYLLKCTKNPQEVSDVLERMRNSGCKLTDDMYNLVLRLFMDWDCQERVMSTWFEMEKTGFGPDRRSYTIMIHGLYEKGRIDDAHCYFKEMTSKGMEAEPRTKLLADSMNIKLKDRDTNCLTDHSHKMRRKNGDAR